MGQIYHVAGERDCHRCIRLRVWGAGKNSRVLQADLLSKAVLPWGCATDGTYPTPKDVRTVIDYALTLGWDPDLVGGTFFLSENEHASEFELADFLLTDRLRELRGASPRAMRARSGMASPSATRSNTSRAVTCADPFMMALTLP
ncbi:hypothetical protein OG589_03020 [Sphaerisporangium sp. NBC_01403]